MMRRCPPCGALLLLLAMTVAPMLARAQDPAVDLGYGKDQCKNGFYWDANKHECVDINECLSLKTLLPLCGDGAKCVNTPGSYKCVCPKGFYYDDKKAKCIDINECEWKDIKTCASDEEDTVQCISSILKDQWKDNGPCGDGSKCVNFPGGFKCVCPKGYYYDETERKCKDINECEWKDMKTCAADDEGFANCIDSVWKNNGPCGDGAKCVNYPGGFKCVCPKGYYYDDKERKCKDIDECQWKDLKTCAADDEGFGNCIDSLWKDKGPCGDGAKCVNYPGGFKCVCSKGFYYDETERKCKDINECEWKTKPFCAADDEEGVDCAKSGWKDVGPCGPHGICINTYGSFKCKCEKGYYWNDKENKCKDIDECTWKDKPICGADDSVECIDSLWADKGPCGDDATCYNTDGGFKCVCPKAYYYDEEKRECKDIDECKLAKDFPICLAHAHCENLIGGFKCVCDDKFYFDEKAERCIPIPLCPKGYKFDIKKGKCVDIDECKEHPSICGKAKCVNTEGAYKCVCPKGFEFNPKSLKCEDIDECKADPKICGTKGYCKNTPGGYKCECDKDYKYDPQYKKCIKDCPAPGKWDVESELCI